MVPHVQRLIDRLIRIPIAPSVLDVTSPEYVLSEQTLMLLIMII